MEMLYSAELSFAAAVRTDLTEHDAKCARANTIASLPIIPILNICTVYEFTYKFCFNDKAWKFWFGALMIRPSGHLNMPLIQHHLLA
jgi:hypothetical protein